MTRLTWSSFVDTARRAMTARRGAAAALLIGAVVTNYGATLLVARLLAVSGFGRYAVVLSIATLAALIASLGLPDGALRFVGIYFHAGERVLLERFIRFARWATVGAGALVGLVVAAGAWLVGPKLAAGDLLGLFLLVPLTALLGLHQQELLGADALRASLGINLSTPLLSALLFVVVRLATSRLTSPEALLCVAASTAVCCLGQALYLAHAASRVVPHEGQRLERIGTTSREWLFSGLRIQLNSVLVYAVDQVDLLTVAAIYGSVDTGAYAAAARISLVVTLFLNAAASVDTPRLASDFHHGRYDEVTERLRQSALFAGVSALAVTVVIAVFAHPILSTFGKGFTRAAPWLIVLCGGKLVNASTGAVGEFLVTTGNEMTAALIAGASLALAIALAVPLAVAFGPVGAAIGVAISVIVQNVWRLVAAARILRVAHAASTAGDA